MYRVQIQVETSEAFQPIVGDEVNSVDNFELVAEQIISTALLDAFNTVRVDEVSIVLPREGNDAAKLNIILTVSEETLKEKNDEKRSIESVELAIENTISAALVNLFGSILIDRVVISPEETETKQISQNAQSFRSSVKETLIPLS